MADLASMACIKTELELRQEACFQIGSDTDTMHDSWHCWAHHFATACSQSSVERDAPSLSA